MKRPGQDSRKATPELLAQYLAGELGEEAANSLRQTYGWTAEGTAVRDVVLETVRKEGEEVVVGKEIIAQRLAVARMRAGVDGPAGRRSVDEGRRIGRFPGKQTLLIGALTMLAVFAIGVGIRRNTTQDTVTQHYVTHPRQRRSITLADGSRMLLAPSTTVTINGRTLDVTGEAFFTVSPHSETPFLVRTTNAVVRVLGTRFAVRRYPDESASRIMVDEGRVAVEAVGSHPQRPRTRGVLSAQMAVLVTDSGMTMTSGVAVPEMISWTSGTVVFSGVPLRDVITELRHLYGAEIRIADTALASHTMRMNVSIETDALPQILDLICATSDAHYTRRGTTYVLSPGRVQTPSPRMAPVRRALPQPELQYGR